MAHTLALAILTDYWWALTCIGLSPLACPQPAISAFLDEWF
jgi:hypothetical protein